MIARAPGISMQEMAGRVVGGWAARHDEATILKSIRRVIGDLREMGLIKEDEGRFFAIFPPKEPPRIPPVEDGPPNDGDSEGAGIRQLIAHPFLFVLSEKEIFERIDRSVGIE